MFACGLQVDRGAVLGWARKQGRQRERDCFSSVSIGYWRANKGLPLQVVTVVSNNKSVVVVDRGSYGVWLWDERLVQRVGLVDCGWKSAGG